MANKLTPGIFEARVTDYGINEGKEGKTYSYIKFAVDINGEWVDGMKFLHFTEKAKDFSYKVLKTCGFNGSMDDFSAGAASNALDLESPVQVVCKDESDGKGGVVCRIAYVNDPEGGGTAKRVDAANARLKLGFDFGEEMRSLGMVTPKKEKKDDTEIPY